MNPARYYAAKASLVLLEGKWIQVGLLAGLCAILTGCSLLTGAAPGPIEETLLGSAAVGAAAIDYILANDLLPPEIGADLAKAFSTVNENLAIVNQGVAEVKANAVTIEQAQFGAGGVVAGVLALVRAWRGGASKGPLRATVQGLKNVVANATAPKV